jgi:hypothetical protein
MKNRRRGQRRGVALYTKFNTFYISIFPEN